MIPNNIMMPKWLDRGVHDVTDSKIRTWQSGGGPMPEASKG
jgi:hypothetical protein